MIGLETTLSKNPHHIENSQPICKANQLNFSTRHRLLLKGISERTIMQYLKQKLDIRD